jgi:uncharacterized delta-60 repeat protein
MSAQDQLSGTLDPAFGKNGMILLDLDGAISATIKGLSVATDGKIYFTGSYIAIERAGYVLGRLNADGSPDPTFGTNGLVIDSFADQPDSLGNAITLLENGSILLLASTRVDQYPAYVPALARYNHSGSLDPDFGTGGKVIIDTPLPSGIAQLGQTAMTTTSQGSDIAQVLPDGKILICTYRPRVGAIFRLQSNGALDLSFNGVGYITLSHPDAPDQPVLIGNVLLQADGKYLGCGSFNGSRNAFVARYNTDGSLDRTFGKEGFVLVASSPPDDKRLSFAQMRLQPNRRILAIGNVISSPSEGMLVSLEPDGSANIQFNGARPVYTRLDNKQTGWVGAAMQTDGKIVVAGAVQGSSAIQFDGVVARFQSNGALDPAFNGSGWTHTDFDESVDGVTAMTLQTDNKTLVAVDYQPQKPAILRYLA